MPQIVEIIKMVAVLAAAATIGNWFLKEIKKSRALRSPWYTPYLSLPGILVLIAILLPVFIYLIF
ncbi:MAG: hypothetical protein B6I22_07265 [Desulfobacteraceae bacterium 4572_123]|nr:MAG: hypothetical protein B6I22_07265 [Desulfobacteraceae bacterium 4572_123]